MAPSEAPKQPSGASCSQNKYHRDRDRWIKQSVHTKQVQTLKQIGSNSSQGKYRHARRQADCRIQTERHTHSLTSRDVRQGRENNHTGSYKQSKRVQTHAGRETVGIRHARTNSSQEMNLKNTVLTARASTRSHQIPRSFMRAT